LHIFPYIIYIKLIHITKTHSLAISREISRLKKAPFKQHFAVQTIKIEVRCHRDYFLLCNYALPKKKKRWNVLGTHLN